MTLADFQSRSVMLPYLVADTITADEAEKDYLVNRLLATCAANRRFFHLMCGEGCRDAMYAFFHHWHAAYRIRPTPESR